MKNLQDIIREEFGKRTIERTELPDYFATSLNPALKLRPYQEECFRYFLNYWENPFEGKEYLTQLMFHMATGSGKTLIMAGVMLYLYEKGYRNFLF
ncbi:MAG: DEAD/DEAH box helicase family protein, partial [Rikenellaceae bacterium]